MDQTSDLLMGGGAVIKVPYKKLSKLVNLGEGQENPMENSTRRSGWQSQSMLCIPLPSGQQRTQLECDQVMLRFWGLTKLSVPPL